MHVQVETYVEKSARVDTSGIDYREAREVGLSDDEVFTLTYFADVENQSLRYLRTLLGMRFAFSPDVAAFLATWSYEEFFHGYELERLMRACGKTISDDRRELKRGSARLNEKLETVFVPILSRLYEREFPAVYLAFGAIQELTTLRGYESLVRSTKNPALKTLCERIARQERRHFAWYFNRARLMLEDLPRARPLVRRLMKLNWVPVGAGVHEPVDVRRLFQILFYPRENAQALVRGIDSKIGELPGLSKLTLMESFFRRSGLV